MNTAQVFASARLHLTNALKALRIEEACDLEILAMREHVASAAEQGQVEHGRLDDIQATQQESDRARFTARLEIAYAQDVLRAVYPALSSVAQAQVAPALEVRPSLPAVQAARESLDLATTPTPFAEPQPEAGPNAHAANVAAKQRQADKHRAEQIMRSKRDADGITCSLVAEHTATDANGNRSLF